MLADSLTKVMNADLLVSTFTVGYFDMQRTAESLIIIETNRIARKAAKQPSA